MTGRRLAAAALTKGISLKPLFAAALQPIVAAQAARADFGPAFKNFVVTLIRAWAADPVLVQALIAANGANAGRGGGADRQKEARQNGTIVNNAVAAMNKISAFSGQISTFISVINDIACQTNLLALNAGV